MTFGYFLFVQRDFRVIKSQRLLSFDYISRAQQTHLEMEHIRRQMFQFPNEHARAVHWTSHLYRKHKLRLRRFKAFGAAKVSLRNSRAVGWVVTSKLLFLAPVELKKLKSCGEEKWHRPKYDSAPPPTTHDASFAPFGIAHTTLQFHFTVNGFAINDRRLWYPRGSRV